MKKSAANKPAVQTFGRFRMLGQEFLVGDFVKVKEINDDQCIGAIQNIIRRGNKDPVIQLRWFYKPTDIFGQVEHKCFSKYELFDSNHIQEIWVQTVYQKVEVITFEQYHSLDEVLDEIYFCRATYDFNQRTLTPPLVEWKRACYCGAIINPDLVYYFCDGCRLLFHKDCVGLELNEEEMWVCTYCEKEMGLLN